ncbi:MAG: pyrroline-5-carboxylate reductase, partial [Candidatus Hydrogenedentales bacterium]
GLRATVLVISVAAGVSSAFISNGLGGGARVVRVMPNTPALVRAGATGLAAGADCTAADVALARRIFEAVGVVEEVRENQLDAVTAISGSGPAYFFYLAECLAKAGEKEGLSTAQANRLAAATLAGAGKLLQESSESPAELRERVTSPGGTTFAALEMFRALDFEGAVNTAVAAAAARSRELGK